MSFHNGYVFLDSPANESNLRRMTVTIHMQDRRNEFRQALDEKGQAIRIGYERMCRKNSNGDSDCSDPRFFPKLYPVSE